MVVGRYLRLTAAWLIGFPPSTIQAYGKSIRARVEIYGLRQVRHQVSESAIVLQGFLFYIFWQFLPLFKHSFEARPLGSSSLAIFVCARWGALVLLPVPVWFSFALLGWSLQPASLLERKWVLACFGHSQLLTSKFIQPGHKTFNILPTSTTCSAFCVTSRSPGALWEKKYFTSCDPHHDIYTFSYWQIFWHSIWHIFWHSIWHSI